jgi:hypothetical protein
MKSSPEEICLLHMKGEGGRQSSRTERKLTKETQKKL